MLYDRVEQTTSTTGTGPLSLIAPTDASRRSFVQAAGSGSQVFYVIETADGLSYECGYGVVAAGTPDTLTRNPILSSNGNALVNFGSGTKRVYSTLPASRSRLVGEVVAWTGSSLPAGYVWANGQNLSRTTYAALFAAFGTTYGAGDGSTTFAVPDLRGRAVIGRDDMGGSAASRITSWTCGIAGTTLGAAGGDQNIPIHAHAYSGVFVTGGNTQTNIGTGSSWWINSSLSTGNAGSGGSANVPPAIVLNYIIYTGV